MQQEISGEIGKEQVGQIREVFIEGYSPEEQVWIGRTYGDARDIDGLLFLHCTEELHTGDMVRARVTAAGEYDLIGEIVS